MCRKVIAFVIGAAVVFGVALKVTTAADTSTRKIIRDKVDIVLKSGELYIGEGKIASLNVLPKLYEKKEFDLLNPHIFKT